MQNAKCLEANLPVIKDYLPKSTHTRPTLNFINAMENQSNLFNFDDDKDDEVDQKQDPNLFSSAVLWSTDWTVKTIIQQIEDRNIDLNPNFQRRDAWSSKTKNRYLESVALQIPIPQIVLAEKSEQRGTYIVLDGKQRLLTLAQFAADLDSDHPARLVSKKQNSIKLSGLEILTDLNGKTYDDIAADPSLKKWRTSFDNHSIRCSIIRAWPNENYLYEVFIRLNTGSSKLSPQELRQALRPGKFTDFITNASGNSKVLQKILGITTPDFRMRDADLLLRLIAFNTRKDKYQGNLKTFLDDTLDVFNRNWDDCEADILQINEKIETAIDFLISNMKTPQTVGRRWNGKGFEYSINRAMLDVQVHSTMNETTRTAITKSDVDLVALAKEICEESRQFYESISGTTKSIGAVETRFSEWNKRLNEKIGIKN